MIHFDYSVVSITSEGMAAALKSISGIELPIYTYTLIHLVYITGTFCKFIMNRTNKVVTNIVLIF